MVELFGNLRHLAVAGFVMFWLPVVTLASENQLSGRAKALDVNKNNRIEKSESRGPLLDNFETIDCDKDNLLDGNEIRGFFSGEGCPLSGVNKTANDKSGDLELSDRSKAADANGNGVIDRSEAGGPLLANFDKIDQDQNNSLDGREIRNFFAGGSPQAGQKSGGGNAASDSKQADKRKVQRKPSVQVDKVIEEAATQTFPIIGRLVSRQQSSIATEISGAVKEMKVSVGDRVLKGGVLAIIESDRLKSERDRGAAVVGQREAMLGSARAELEKTIQEADRVRDLKSRSSSAFSRAKFEDIEKDVIARSSELDERAALLKEARAQLARSEIDLADTNVVAPFDGVIIEKHIEVGTYLKVGDPVVTLLNDRNIEVEAEVPTDQIYALKPGVSVTVILDEGTEHPARVRALIPYENLRTRTRAVRFSPEFGVTKKALAADQSVTVQIPMEIRRTVTVHKDAIIRRGQNAVVFLVRDGNAFARQVTLGSGVGDRFVVLDGLKAGDVVVIRGNERLGGGGPVNIVSARGKTGSTER